MEGCSRMCVEVFRKDAAKLLELLKEKDVNLKVSHVDGPEFDKDATLHFLCHNFSACSKAIVNCVNETNVYEIGYLRLKGGKWCCSIKYKMV
jgi:hypothetical protein